MIAALEAVKEREAPQLALVQTRELKPLKDNRGVVRGLVKSCEARQGKDGKAFKWVVFTVVEIPLPANHVVKNGYNREVARVSPDGRSVIFTYGKMDDRVNGFLAKWAEKKADVKDEIGVVDFIDEKTGVVTKLRRTGEQIGINDTVSMRMEGTIEDMSMFFLADFFISMTEYVSDPERALRPGELPVYGVSRVVKAASVVRRTSPLEIFRFLDANPSFTGIPVMSLPVIFERNQYVHQHYLDPKMAPRDLSNETYFVPMFPESSNYVDYFGDGPGALVLADEDRTVDKVDPNKVQNAHEWHKFDTPLERHVMYRMKLSLAPYSSAAEVLHPEEFPVPMFPRTTMSVPVYEDALPFKINDLNLWERMAKVLFSMARMYIPTRIHLYESGDSPANVPGGGGNGGSQHLFMAAKKPFMNFVDDLKRCGLVVSAQGAASLVNTPGRLFRSSGQTLSDVRQTRSSDGDATFYNLNECTAEAANKMMLPEVRKNWLFVVVLSKPLNKDLATIFNDVRTYAAEHPKAVAGEVLLSDKWALDPKAYLKDTYKGVPVEEWPEFPDDHVIIRERIRTSSVYSSTDVFVLYAIDLVACKRAEREVSSRDSPFSEVLKHVNLPLAITAVPIDAEAAKKLEDEAMAKGAEEAENAAMLAKEEAGRVANSEALLKKQEEQEAVLELARNLLNRNDDADADESAAAAALKEKAAKKSKAKRSASKMSGTDASESRDDDTQSLGGAGGGGAATSENAEIMQTVRTNAAKRRALN